MTVARLLPLQLHGAIEAAVAPAVIVLPFLLGFSATGLVGAVILGGLLMGSALHASSYAPRISAHASMDLVVAIVTVGLVLGLVVTGDFWAAAFFLGAGLIQALLSVTTRYSGAG